jgi:putative flippase GtrA
MTNSQFVRFIVTGGIAACVNLASRYLLNFTMSFPYAVAIAYLFGMATAYVLNRAFVFEKSGRTAASEIWRFAIVNAVAAAQVWGISVLLAEVVFPTIALRYFPLEIAHLIGVVVPIFTSYVGHKYFSFTKARARTAPVRAENTGVQASVESEPAKDWSGEKSASEEV